jgi:phage portal protein BeeE
MITLKTDSGAVTIGDSSIPGVNTHTTWGVEVKDPPIPISSLTRTGPVDPQAIWKTQPSVRKVVEFAARNVASVPWKAYVRASDDDRQRASGSPVERVLRHPRPHLTHYQLMYRLTVDAMLYDRWCVALLPTGTLQRIPPRELVINSDGLDNISRIGVSLAGGVVDITDLPLALGAGWSAWDGDGISPLVTLSSILREQMHAVEWRDAQWERAPKITGVLKRPADSTAGKWDPSDRERFMRVWREFREGRAAGTPILEDGMDYESIGSTVSPADAKDIEGRQLTDVEVCSSFHIPPELVGARQGTFSNIDAFRSMLFGPTLGPQLTQFEEAFNAEIVGALDGTAGIYAELDREAAMNGSFAEQATYLQTAVGGPFMSRAEARGRVNLPHVDGTDDLIVPMNVTEGGQASPTDSGSQNRKDTCI